MSLSRPVFPKPPDHPAPQAPASQRAPPDLLKPLSLSEPLGLRGRPNLLTVTGLPSSQNWDRGRGRGRSPLHPPRDWLGGPALPLRPQGRGPAHDRCTEEARPAPGPRPAPRTPRPAPRTPHSLGSRLGAVRLRQTTTGRRRATATALPPTPHAAGAQRSRPGGGGCGGAGSRPRGRAASARARARARQPAEARALPRQRTPGPVSVRSFRLSRGLGMRAAARACPARSQAPLRPS
ncbi:uncharacterized protein LOC144330858 [Macaca mulatta]